MARILASNVLIVLCLCCAYVAAQDFIFPDNSSHYGCRTPDRQRGTCKSIFDCDTIGDYIGKLQKVFNNADIKKHLNPYICGRDGEYPKVCCPPSGIPMVRTEEDPQLKLLPLELCGLADNKNKIVNGRNASLYEFPWMAALMYESRYGPEFQCGGSLINKRYVLTAAHCLKVANKRLQRKLVQVRLGEHNFNTVEDCIEDSSNICAPPVQDFDVSLEDTVIHPKYNPTTLANDIALIRLRRDADLNLISVIPVCLPVLKTTKERKLEKTFTVSGWDTTGNNFSLYLLKVQVSAVDNDKCSELYKGPILITDDQLCAGGENSKNTCTGGSGGPLVQEVSVDDVWRSIQYGIVSAGPILCEKINFPARYMRVTSYVDWILENIRS